MPSRDGRADNCSCMIGTSAILGGRIPWAHTGFCSCKASIHYFPVDTDAQERGMPRHKRACNGLQVLGCGKFRENMFKQYQKIGDLLD